MDIDEQGLLADVDELARLSSVEQFHASPLPVLRRVAHELTGEPDTRTGRYTAVRDAITAAIDRIEDTAYGDAAEALLGYGDRWRSVRDRGTDAGRAFTPNVSYDAFRRKSGRNYRTNTIRMVTDALLRSLAETSPPSAEHNAAGATEAEPAPTGFDRPAEPAADARLPDRPQAEPQGVPRRRHVRVAIASALAVTLALVLGAVWLSDGSDNSEVAGVAVTRSTLTDEAIGEVDVTRHCRSEGSDLFARRTTTTDSAWVCTNAAATVENEPSMTAACVEQYGPSAIAVNGSGWTCRLELEDLHQPAAGASDGCGIALGSFDEAHVAAFDRFPERFAQTRDELDDDVCADGPMHFYGDPDPSLGGVAQLLERDGDTYGAILADDPTNVVLVQGPVWKAYRDVRGLAIYQLGSPLLEDRVGYPIVGVEAVDGVWRLGLSGGGALVSTRLNGNYVWMPEIAVTVWEATGGPDGCLGMPVRSPRTQAGSPLEQEFDNAIVRIDPETGKPFIEPDVC